MACLAIFDVYFRLEVLQAYVSSSFYCNFNAVLLLLCAISVGGTSSS